MNRLASLILCALVALAFSSCGPRRNKEASQTPAEAMAPYFETVDGRTPIRLCEAVLTAPDAVEAAFPESDDDYFTETTPEVEAFYFPADDIKNEPLVRKAQLRYNYVALFNRVIHSYEWFQRVSTGLVDEEEETEPFTKKDTLEWIRFARPKVPQAVIDKALPDAKARTRALSLLRAYDRFDGDDSDESPFSKAVGEYTEALSELPELVSQDELDSFEEGFWEWYDKKNVVPEIDGLVRMHFDGYEGEYPSEELLENLKRAVEAEPDIDRRTILALEYAKFDHNGGAALLGEILESRIYTKYLVEAWLSWRACVQMGFSPSSFSIVANNYFDRLRTVCLDTMVRHCLESGDKNAECLVENLTFCEIIHRMGSLYGNGSLAAVANLTYGGEFVHPRLLEDKEEN